MSNQYSIDHFNNRRQLSRVASFSSSPFDARNNSASNAAKQEKQSRRHRPLKWVPLKPAVDVAPKAREFFLQLLKNPPRPNVCGVRLNYKQSSSGQPRMVFSFEFVTADQLEAFDEAVPLDEQKFDRKEEDNSETCKEEQSPTLYVSGNAFLKVLGATVDVDENFLPVLYDREGNRMDPNA